jgi:hypothetical protein
MISMKFMRLGSMAEGKVREKQSSQLRLVRPFRRGAPVPPKRARARANDSRSMLQLRRNGSTRKGTPKGQGATAKCTGGFDGKSKDAWGKGSIWQVVFEDVQGEWQWGQPEEEKPSKREEMTILDQDGYEIVKEAQEICTVHAGDLRRRCRREGR